MYTIVQISDLHFGKTDSQVVASLPFFIASLKPNLTVVSGDLTLRARTEEFLAAAQFLNLLPKPQIVVPGNHDTPLYNLWLRFFKPHKGFLKNISTALESFYSDGHVTVVALNTIHPVLGQAGRIRKKQLEYVKEKFSGAPEDALKILVSHHPVNKIWSVYKGLPLYSQRALFNLVESKVDMFMSGHLHQSRSGLINFSPKAGHTSLLLEAGTATSLRYRGEVNAFNTVILDGKFVEISRYAWDRVDKNFKKILTERYFRGDNGLSKI